MLISAAGKQDAGAVGRHVGKAEAAAAIRVAHFFGESGGGSDLAAGHRRQVSGNEKVLRQIASPKQRRLTERDKPQRTLIVWFDRADEAAIVRMVAQQRRIVERDSQAEQE